MMLLAMCASVLMLFKFGSFAKQILLVTLQIGISKVVIIQYPESNDIFKQVIWGQYNPSTIFLPSFCSWSVLMNPLWVNKCDHMTTYKCVPLESQRIVRHPLHLGIMHQSTYECGFVLLDKKDMGYFNGVPFSKITIRNFTTSKFACSKSVSWAEKLSRLHP